MSFADYDEMVQALTKANVSLTNAEGEYRSTYDILKDIAKIWNNLDSMSQAGLAEKLAGKWVPVRIEMCA